MLGLETKFRVKTRLLAKVSFVMSSSGESPTAVKKKKSIVENPASGVQRKSGMRYSISEPTNEKLFMENAVTNAALTGINQLFVYLFLFISCLFTDTKLNPFAKKLPKGAEACLILACTADFAPQPMMIFVRLQKPQIFRDHCEVSVPTRFVGIIVGPPSAEMRVVDIGKALGTLMSDQVSFWKTKRAERT